MSIFSERKVKFSDGCGDTSVEKGSVHKRKFSDCSSTSVEKSSKRETHKSKGSARRDTSVEQSLRMKTDANKRKFSDGPGVVSVSVSNCM